MGRTVFGAFWDARAAALDECAARIVVLLRALSAIDPLLSQWRDQVGSLQDALARPLVTTRHDDLVARLLAGRNRTDVGGQVIEELGYAVTWWNGRDTGDGGVTLRVQQNVTSEYVGNSVVMNLPESRAFPRLYQRNVARKLILTIISIFEPDRAVWATNSLRKAQAEPDRRLEGGGIAYGRLIGYPAGWATFLNYSSDIKFDNTLLPAAAKVDRLGSGILVTVGDSPGDPQLSDVLAVRTAMGYTLPPG